MSTRTALIWGAVGILTFFLLILCIRFMLDSKKRNKRKDLEAGARKTAGGKYRRDMYKKTGRTRVPLSKSKIGKPQQLPSGGVEMPSYAHVKGNEFHIPDRPPSGPRGPAPSLPRMVAPSPRAVAAPPRATRAPPRPARPQVRIPNYDYNQPMGPISPMKPGEWQRSHTRHSAVSAVSSR